VAAIWSNSLSLIASLVDSALDLLCTIIIWTTNKLVGWRLSKLKKKFPVGRRRLEPIGILVFSIIMVISFMQILKESVEKLLPGGSHKVAELPPAAVFAMVATIVVKGTIWFGCARVQTTQVQALAQDCKTVSLLPARKSDDHLGSLLTIIGCVLQHLIPSIPARWPQTQRVVARSAWCCRPLPVHHL
jgi:divalent metal cation (Fe/Co/Zn/Cd) transporter